MSYFYFRDAKLKNMVKMNESGIKRFILNSCFFDYVCLNKMIHDILAKKGRESLFFNFNDLHQNRVSFF